MHRLNPSSTLYDLHLNLARLRNAAQGGHWKVVLVMADRAFDCHTQARPKGRGDAREGDGWTDG